MPAKDSKVKCVVIPEFFVLNAAIVSESFKVTVKWSNLLKFLMPQILAVSI